MTRFLSDVLALVMFAIFAFGMAKSEPATVRCDFVSLALLQGCGP